MERGGFVSNSAKVRGDSGMVSGSKRMAGRLGSNAHGFSFSAGKRYIVLSIYLAYQHITCFSSPSEAVCWECL